MQLRGVLVLVSVTLSTAYGIRCYTCMGTAADSCTEISTCSSLFNRCFSLSVGGLYTKGCQSSYTCVSGTGCCEGDLCNAAVVSGPSVVLLLVSTAIVTLFA